MWAQLTLTQLAVETEIGCLPAERGRYQTLFIDCSYRYQIDPMVEHDTLLKGLNYTEFSEFIREFCKKSTFQLIETLTFHLLNSLCRQFPITSVTLTVHKPQALAGAAPVAITLHSKDSLT